MSPTTTWSRNRTPAQGSASCTGSYYMAVSPICLNLWTHLTSFPSTSRTMKFSPLPFLRLKRHCLLNTFFFGCLHGSQEVCDYGQLVGVVEVDGSSFILGQLTQSKSPQVLSSSLIVDLSHDLAVSYGSLLRQQSQPYRRMSPYASISS